MNLQTLTQVITNTPVAEPLTTFVPIEASSDNEHEYLGTAMENEEAFIKANRLDELDALEEQAHK